MSGSRSLLITCMRSGNGGIVMNMYDFGPKAFQFFILIIFFSDVGLCLQISAYTSLSKALSSLSPLFTKVLPLVLKSQLSFLCSDFIFQNGKRNYSLAEIVLLCSFIFTSIHNGDSKVLNGKIFLSPMAKSIAEKIKS